MYLVMDFLQSPKGKWKKLSPFFLRGFGAQVSQWVQSGWGSPSLALVSFVMDGEWAGGLVCYHYSCETHDVLTYLPRLSFNSQAPEVLNF